MFLRCVPALSPVVADSQLGLMLLVGRRTVGCVGLLMCGFRHGGVPPPVLRFVAPPAGAWGRVELRCVSESPHDDELGRFAGQIVGVSAWRATLQSHRGEVKRLAGFN